MVFNLWLFLTVLEDNYYDSYSSNRLMAIGGQLTIYGTTNRTLTWIGIFVVIYEGFFAADKAKFYTKGCYFD